MFANLKARKAQRRIARVGDGLTAQPRPDWDKLAEWVNARP